jgi:iron(III) transport system substrate-binding protein
VPPHRPKTYAPKLGRALLVLVVASLVAPGCGTSPSAGAGGAGTRSAGPGAITLYNGQHPETTEALVAGFEKATGITVHIRDGDEDDLANQIVQEGTGSPADVIYTENSQALQFLQGKRLLAPVAPSTLSGAPSRYNSPAGDWVGISARVSGIVFNTRLVSASQLPTSVMGLAEPKWAGKLGIAPSETDFEPIITSVVRTYGHAAALAWLKALSNNAAGHTYPDNETLTAAVNHGQVALAVVNHYYWYRLRYEVGRAQMHSLFTYFSPHDPGYVVDVSGAAVLRSSRAAAAAQRFLAFLVSKAGEEIVARSHSYEYPLGSGVLTAQPLRPFADLKPVALTIAQLGDGSSAIALLHQAQLL